MTENDPPRMVRGVAGGEKIVRAGYQPTGQRGYQPKADRPIDPLKLKPPSGGSAVQAPVNGNGNGKASD